MKKIVSMRGQNLTEVALVVGIVGLVLIGMQVYVTRGVQGKLKDLTDNMIGTKQEAYTQDVSGLEVNTSDSRAIITSKVKAEELGGGSKNLTSIEPEITTQISTSESKE